MRNWKKLNSKTVYQDHHIKIIKDDVIRPDGKKSTYSYLEKNPGIFIIAKEDNSIYLIKENRYPVKETIIQLPGGVLNDKEEIFFGAKRELFEETGINAKIFKNLGEFYIAPGHENSKICCILAENLDISNIKTKNQEGDEAIEDVLKIKEKNLKNMIKKGKIKCGITLACLNLYFQNI